MLIIEARPYGEESTDEEIELLKSQVEKINGDTILWKEVPVPTVFQINIFNEKLKELTVEKKNYYMIVDLTCSERPKADAINAIRKMLNNFTGLKYLAVFTGKNRILNIAAKFLVARLGLLSSEFSMHKTKEEALEAIQSAK